MLLKRRHKAHPYWLATDNFLASEPGSESDVSNSIQLQIENTFSLPPNIAVTLNGIRRIKHGSRGRRTSLFPSRKNEGSISLESRLELSHALMLERNPNVRQYRTQAIKIALPGGMHAFPDFVVQKTDGSFEIHEVKPSIAHLSEDEHARFRHIEMLLSPISIRFQLIDVHSLPNRTELESLQRLYLRGHALNFKPRQIQFARDLLEGKPCANMAHAYQQLSINDLPPSIADYMLFHGYVQFPLSSGRKQ